MITVIIPAYNAEKFLLRAVDSIKSQTLQNWEIIIINDASTDGTLALMNTLAKNDKRIKCIDVTENQGQSNARNLGIKAAKGEWVTLLDADDAYEPERLETLLNFVEHHHLDMAADNITYFDAYLNEKVGSAMAKGYFNTYSHEGRKAIGKIDWTLESFFKNELPYKSFKWGLFKLFVKKSFLESSEVLYRRRFRMGEDALIYMELLSKGAKAAICSEPMYVYTTSTGRKSGINSGTSTSNYKFSDHIKIYEYYEKHYKGEISAQEYKAFLENKRLTKTYQDYLDFKGVLLKDKNIIKATAMLLANLSILLYIGAAFRNVWQRKFA